MRAAFRSQLTVNVASGVAAAVINAAVMAIGYRVYIQRLGWETYGVWLLMSTVLTFTQLGNLGLSTAVAREVSRARASGDVEEVQRVITTAVAFVTVTALLSMAGLSFGRSWIAGLLHLGPAMSSSFIAYLPYVGGITAYSLVLDAWAAALPGAGRADLLYLCQCLSQLVALGASLAFLHWIGGLIALIAANGVACVFLHIVTVACIRRTLGCRPIGLHAASAQTGRRLLAVGTGVAGGSALALFLGPFNKLLLARAAGPASVAVYDLAFNAAMRLRTFFEAGVKAIMPEISSASVSGECGQTRIAALRRRSLAVTVAAAVPVYTTLFCAARPLLSAWLGSAFRDGMAPAFQISIVGSLVSILGVPAFYLLVGLGRSTRVFIGNVLQSGVNVAAALISVAVFAPVTASHLLFASCAGIVAGSWYLINASNNEPA